jgi:inorganic pyrophosphatase
VEGLTKVPQSFRDSGAPDTVEFRKFMVDPEGRFRSPWHDVPLRPDPERKFVLNYVNEIPKGYEARRAAICAERAQPMLTRDAVCDALRCHHLWCDAARSTTAKMEIATDEEFNPIKQDTKRGVLRYFKAGNIPFNYGCLPRTWEKPSELHAGFPGDNDPVDLVELSREPIATGTVLPVKVLSAIALIDQGEIDWKIIGIALGSDLADSLHGSSDARSANCAR